MMTMFKYAKWDERGVPCISMYHMYFIPQKDVGFEMSYVYFEVYMFFKTTKYALLLTSDVVQVTPLSRNSMEIFFCLAG